MNRRGEDQESGYIVEYVSHGDYMKVSAIDPVTRREVSIVGDPAAGREALARIAIRKLRFVLNKKPS